MRRVLRQATDKIDMATAAVIATPAIRADIIDSPDPVQQPQKNEAVIVSLPTLTVPSYEQKVIGKKSCSAAVVEEFRGIPYGIVPARWQHSLLRTSLPEDVFDASRNGFVNQHRHRSNSRTDRAPRPRCPQPQEPNNTNTFQAHLDFPSGVDESEFDCLNLFIVRPSAAALTEAGFDIASDGLPVYFYIHGGGYGFGAGTDPMWSKFSPEIPSEKLLPDYSCYISHHRSYPPGRSVARAPQADDSRRHQLSSQFVRVCCII